VEDNLLEIKNLKVEYHTFEGVAKAVNGVNLRLGYAEALGLVGETGAGKTTTALSILRLLPKPAGRVTQGEIFFKGRDLLNLPEKSMRKLQGNQISMIFQNPLTSLNPVFTIGEQISLVFQIHQGLTRDEAKKRAGNILEVVGIPKNRLEEYPHQFSGGMRQRVGIASAIACNPELLIADEPTTALDVTIQAQVLELMQDLREKYRMSLILITHNLGIVAEMCSNVAVIYAGQIIEYGSIKEVFENPAHFYTKGLLSSLPSTGTRRTLLKPIQGFMPNPMELPTGCKFHPRCPSATELCQREEPGLFPVSDHHSAACFVFRKG